MLNVAVTEAGVGGYATVYGCGVDRPLAANVNFAAGETVSNSVISDVDASGDVCIYVRQATHVVVDVGGYFELGSGYRSLMPARLLDSRPPTPSAQATDYSLLFLNDYRQSLGLGLFTADPNMSAYAVDWARTMARSGFGHSDGPWRENIAWSGAASLTPRQAAALFHRLWVESAPHRVSMVNAEFSFVGIGMYRDATGWYGVHVFRA